LCNSSELRKENRRRREKSSGIDVQPQTTDDEPISAEEKPKTPESTSEPEASTKPEPKKNLSDNGKGNTEDATAIEAATIPEAGNSEDSGGDLVAIAQEKLHEARAASQTILCVATPEALAATIPPDREITLQILQLFADAGDDGADFEAWLKSTVDRGLGRKARDSLWGLYLADAKMEAGGLPAKRAAAAKAQAAIDISRSRQQAEQAEAEAAAAAEADRPMLAMDAYDRIRVDVQGRGVPRPFKWRLERTGELISPNALAAAIRGWKRCATCQDSGLVGTALDKNLAFCACAAGAEVQHPPLYRELEKPEDERFHKGVAYCRQMIERVHESAKSLLVAACSVVELQFAADVMAECEVSDDGATLEIRVPDTRFAMTEGDVRKVLDRLKWQRGIVITGGRQVNRSHLTPAAIPGPRPVSRPPITQADIDAEIAKRRQKIPPQMEAGCDLTACSSAAGIQ
jgi:hypothetical protein